MATWYIDNRLSTGLNNGTSPANAWRSIYDSAYGTNSGSVAAGDTIEFVAGSGPYREAFHATRIAKITDVSFNAAGKTITSQATNLGSISSTAGQIVRIQGSGSNDGQYTIASVSGAGPYVWTLDSTNALTDEAAGATITITNVTDNLGSYALEQKRSGSSVSPIVWKLNGVEINSGINLTDSTKYKWTQSAAKPGEWYVTRLNGSNPSIQRPDSIVVAGQYWNTSAGDADHNFGTVGSLTRDGQPGWGNNDTLGFSTVYVKATANPAALGWTIEKSELTSCVYNGLNYHTFRGPGTMKFSNTGDGTFGTAVIVMRGGATGYRLEQGLGLLYGGGHGFEIAGTSGTQTATCDHVITYFCGHRGFYLSGTSAGAVTLNIFNCVDYGSHLFALFASGTTGTYTMNVYGCISANNEAGAIDKKSSAAILREDFNCWFPRMTAAGGALGYVSTANWTKTGPNDIPARTATTTSSISALTDPQFTALSDLSFAACDFHLKSASMCLGRGPWDVGATFTDAAAYQYTGGNSGAPRAPNMGIYQNFPNSRPRSFEARPSA